MKKTRTRWTREEAQAFGRRLLETREAANKSQREISFPGCTAAYISRVEKGERYPSVVIIRGLAERLGCSAEWLETGQEIGMVDVLLGKLTEATEDGLRSIGFHRGTTEGDFVSVDFDFDGKGRTAVGENISDALMKALVWTERVAALRSEAEARSREHDLTERELADLEALTYVADREAVTA